MLRGLTLAFAVFAAPARAWDFMPLPVCTLSHATPGADVTVTYDPATALYAITLTRRAAPWAAAPVFAIRFEGGRALTISTDRHQRSADGRALTVTDTGFGNVLNGLEFNRTATAETGDSAEVLPLDGAAPAVQAFRACAVAAVA